MALPPSNTTDEAFLREVDEELRRSQMMNLWQRWGLWIVGALVVGIAVFGGMLYFQSRATAAEGTRGQKYDQALRDMGANKDADAKTALEELAKGSGDGYRAMAMFAQADIMLRKQDVKGAAAKFGEIAADTSLPQPFRELATVRQTSTEFDTLKPEVVIDRLKAVAAPESPWLGSAGELLAIAYMKQGKREEAGKLYGQIAGNEKVPESIRQRAVQMASVLGADVAGESGEKKAQ